MVNINIEIPDDLHKKIKIFCVMNSITMKDFIISSLEKKINLSNLSSKNITKLIKINKNE